MLVTWKKSYDKARQCIKMQRCHFADKGLYSQSYGFSSSHVKIWEFEHKESWVPKNWCFWTEVLEKTLESPLDYKIKSVNPKGNESWIFIGRTEAEALILLPSGSQRQEEDTSLEATVISHHSYFPWVSRARKGDWKNSPSFMPAMIRWWCLPGWCWKGIGS